MFDVKWGKWGVDIGLGISERALAKWYKRREVIGGARASC